MKKKKMVNFFVCFSFSHGKLPFYIPFTPRVNVLLCYEDLEFQTVCRTRGFMILQINGASGCWWRQIDVIFSKKLLVFGHPIAKHVCVIRWDDCDLCKMTKNALRKQFTTPPMRCENSSKLPKSLFSHVCLASSKALYTSRLGSVPENT